MRLRTICILGGTGFVGHHLAQRLGRAGYRVRILTRRRERHRELLVIPGTSLVECDIHDRDALAEQMAGCDAVINLVGVLNEGSAATSRFQACHVELVEKIVDAAGRNNLKRFLHMSALNANAGITQGEYLRSKGEGEDIAHRAAATGLMVTSFRPSVIFGKGDSFFNRFAGLLRLSPGIFPLACAQSRFAPVHVGDVAGAFVSALDNRATFGKRLELCGPSTYTLRQLVQYTAQVTGLRRRVIPLSDKLARLQARFLQVVPGKPFTMDNYYSLQHDSVCSRNDWEILGITPTPLESVVPLYLGGKTQRNRYDSLRQQARRS